MSDLDQEIGSRLRQARKTCGYRSARAFAKEQEIPESTYSQHETGKRSLNPETLLRYCSCLGIEPNWLLTGRDSLIAVEQEADSVTEVTLNASLRSTNIQSVDGVSVKAAADAVSATDQSNI